MTITKWWPVLLIAVCFLIAGVVGAASVKLSQASPEYVKALEDEILKQAETIKQGVKVDKEDWTCNQGAVTMNVEAVKKDELQSAWQYQSTVPGGALDTAVVAKVPTGRKVLLKRIREEVDMHCIRYVGKPTVEVQE